LKPETAHHHGPAKAGHYVRAKNQTPECILR
jgi:hypothetical protein